MELLLLLLFLSGLLPFSAPTFSPGDNYLLNCGSTAAVTPEYDGRSFLPDADGYPGSVSLSFDRAISIQDPDLSTGVSVLYQTARVFAKPSSYHFKINDHGTHLVRLHFYPFSTQSYNLSTAVFDVSASGVPLLTQFRVLANQTQVPVVLREFFFQLNTSNLKITFYPSMGSYFAFVNAIEVFSAPENLIADGSYLVTPAAVLTYNGLSSQVLETLYRVNVGGPKLAPKNDTLWRTWVPDLDFLRNKSSPMAFSFTGKINYQDGGATREDAPESVYGTAQEMKHGNSTASSVKLNITWDYPVNSGHQYFMRLHFCDIVSTALYELYFNVYINGYLASEDLDLSSLGSTLASPYYKDFVVSSDISGNMIQVSVSPSNRSLPSRTNAILNGLEIMRMKGIGLFEERSHKKTHVILICGILGSFLVICFFVASILIALWLMKQRKPKPRRQDTIWSPLPGHTGSSYSKLSERTNAISASPAPNFNLGLKISYSDVLLATNNFDQSYEVGSGEFGKVYKGVLRDGRTVAIKRGMPGSRQGLPQFQTEILFLSKIRHRHLVSLIGYCEEQSEMILVYELMERGPLKDHLYGSGLPCLSWKRRLEICIGSARGLHYLHTGSAHGIIHRDVKSTNILLDENYVAKVAGFGLSRSGPFVNQTHVSTNVKGSVGYLDPEYLKTQQLTDKSDVYSFGVVLLEVLCARPAIDSSLSRDQMNLAEWGVYWYKKGLLEKIVDPLIKETIRPYSLTKFVETAVKCLAQYGVDRPPMSDVLWNLEYALQIQETAIHREPYEDSNNGPSDFPLPYVRQVPSSNSGFQRDNMAGSSYTSSEVTTSQVFSQLLVNEGR